MRRNQVLQAAISATLFGLPVIATGQPGTYVGPMGVANFSSLPSWTSASDWAGGQIPGITAGTATAVFGNVNQAANNNLPFGGFIGIVENQANITLSTIDVFNNVLGTSIYSPSSGATTINFSGAGTINLPNTLSLPPFIVGGWLGNSLFTNLAGTNGLTINGSGGGYLWLGGNNSGLSGGLTINAATVWMVEQPDGAVDSYGRPTGAISDNELGAAHSTVTLNGGTISYFSDQLNPTAYTSSDNYVIGAAGGTLVTGFPLNPVYNGTFSGSGTLAVNGNIAFESSGTNSGFSGALHFYGDAADTIGQGVSFPNVPAVYDDSTVYLDNSGSLATATPKFSSSTQFILNGGQLALKGSSNKAYTESVGTITGTGGLNTITMIPAMGSAGLPTVTLNSTGIVRQNGTDFYVHGYALGGVDPASPNAVPPSGGESFVFAPNLTSFLVGAGGSSNFAQGGGTPSYNSQVSIIPWIIGDADASAANGGPGTQEDTGTGYTTFATYSATTGIRPLYVNYNGVAGGDEFVHSLTGTGAGSFAVKPTSVNNVYLTQADNGSNSINLGGGSVSVNSLILSNPQFTAGDGGVSVSNGTINITSGALLANTAGGVVSANINFGAAEGVIIATDATNNGNTTFSGILSGSGSLSRGGSGSVVFSGNNTYTGATYLNAGFTAITHSVLPNTAGPFGNSSQPIYMSTGTDAPNFEFQWAEAILQNSGGTTLTIGRQLIVANTSGDAIGAGIQADSPFNFTGSISIAPGTQLANMGGTIVYGNSISGGGYIGDLDGGNLPPVTYLLGNNSYSGGTSIGVPYNPARPYGAGPFVPVYFYGTDSAFGTGTVSVQSSAAAGVDLNAIGNRTIGNVVNIASAVNFDNPADGSSGGNTVFTNRVTFSGLQEITLNNNAVTFDNLYGYGFATTGNGTVILPTANNIPAVSQGTFTGNDVNGAIEVGTPGNDTNAAPTPGGVVSVQASGALGTAFVSVEGGNGSAIQIQAPTAGGSVTIANPLAISGTGVGGNGAIESVQGNNTISTNVTLTAFNTGPNGGPTAGTDGSSVIGVDAGTLTVTGEINTATIDGSGIPGTTLTKVGGGQLNVGSINVGPLNINAGTLAIIEGTGGGSLGAIHAPTSGTLGTSVVNGTLTLAAGATLDLTTHAMVINYNGQGGANLNYEGIPSPIGELTFGKHTPTQSYPAGTITRYVQNASDGGSWDLPGITSSVAENDFTGTTAVGVIDQNDLFALQGNDYTTANGGPGTWEGVPVANDNNVLVRYTYYGDTNLDGTVDATDVDNVIQGFEGFGDGWLYGDFNYDGLVNGLDVTELIIGFSGQKNPMGDGGISPGQAQFLLSIATGITPAQIAKFDAIVGVPEPTTIGLLGVAVAGLLGKRRRR